MNPVDRLENCLLGNPLDRPPVAFWQHFPVKDQQQQTFVDATLEWQQQYPSDFLKVMPAASFCLYEWGLKDNWIFNNYGVRQITYRPVQTADDWKQLNTLNPEEGKLGSHLAAIGEILKRTPDSLPVFATIFSPTSQAANLAGIERLQDHSQNAPDILLQALINIAESISRFIQMALRLGVSGFYWVEKNLENLQRHQNDIRTIDQIALAPANAARWNCLHIHEGNFSADRFRGLPFHILSQHNFHLPDIRNDALTQFDGVLCGGLQRNENMLTTDPELIRSATRRLVKETPNRLIIGADCCLRIDTPKTNIDAVFSTLANRRR